MALRNIGTSPSKYAMHAVNFIPIAPVELSVHAGIVLFLVLVRALWHDGLSPRVLQTRQNPPPPRAPAKQARHCLDYGKLELLIRKVIQFPAK